jgi:hypothetical protein
LTPIPGRRQCGPASGREPAGHLRSEDRSACHPSGGLRKRVRT